MTPSRFVEKQVSVTPQVVLFFLTIVFIKSPCTVSEQVVRSIYITGVSSKSQVKVLSLRYQELFNSFRSQFWEQKRCFIFFFFHRRQ